jgi:hypothetical protein
MNMPRFTAEASLYKTSRSYQSRATQSYNNREQSVISQLRRGVILNPRTPSSGVIYTGGLCQFACDVAYTICLSGCLVGSYLPHCEEVCHAGYAYCSGLCGNGTILV